MTFKLALDVAVLLLVILSILDAGVEKASANIATVSSLARVRFNVAINICFCSSITCVIALEVCLQIF